MRDEFTFLAFSSGSLPPTHSEAVRWKTRQGLWYDIKRRCNPIKCVNAAYIKQKLYKARCGGASRIVNKAHRVSYAIAGVGEKPTP